ncbi:Flp pilus assembly protein CpaB [Agromyces binzhouensis]|uniref:Flp pilus assembly protein CpaB n=1 Tax=Agromyces binzhouensis TaxID=1817495 RepID=A0A4Q2JPS7_9MICO|nr:RcpC/CpaB family pilus assembly protein [Agromyces binzhouensis]RXZ50251.1 Flp pilus assembly protein CpaB [Agromyces binzhouensis]
MKTRIIGALVALVLAIVGTVVLVGYVRGADQRAAEGAEFVDVYVVDESIPEGTPAAQLEEFISLTELPAISVAEDRVTDLADLEGLVAAAELLPGDQLREDRFVDPAVLAAQGEVPVPEGMQEVSVALEVQRVVGGAIQPGSRIGIVVTNKIQPGQPNAEGTVTTSPATRFIDNQVLVTRVKAGSTFTPADGEETTNAVQNIMVTLAMTTPQIEKLVWAREMQEDDLAGVWLTLQNEDTSTDGSQLIGPANILP